ncbi:hypothetical protein RHMOL_Rhmol01G0079000 [Rhododendron molle]|uniref:Uncharacterized protein n=3 Tax=Rhododendron molle TaxID=49168 RepID=A0ACC0PYW7_RHOML|nr:hypothetical protein RHMOL_Rhmol01G0079000 [Rhododendron molle]KAI8570948.1 hypothetical protein RHMOL_Rhmol01G0079000 [Rhododendron molle]KAI8570949.1 hypothetical protein RHMOL_Rhmol01G0079000 [Rhododendron molle]
MEVSTPEPRIKNPTDRYPLLVEPQQNNEHPGHVIDIERACGASSSSSCRNGSSSGSNMPHHDVRMSSTVPLLVPQLPPSPLNGSNSRRSSVARGGEGSGRRRWSPFNVVLWLWIQLVFTVGQIIAAIFVLSVSTKEYSQTRLLAWIVGYAVGSTASLPIIYWRYLHQNQARSSETEGGQTTSSGSWNGQTVRVPNARLGAMMDHLKMALDCFFAIWFVVGNVWIFGGHSSSSDAPNLYRLCIVFLTISSIGYALPFFLCSMICCCLPCIASILGVRDNLIRMRGASEETINALPTHKFKSKNKKTQSSGDSAPGVDDGGFVAAGTERERIISEEDAVLIILLANFYSRLAHSYAEDLLGAQMNINATDAKPIITNKLPLNFPTPLLLGVAFESNLEPVPPDDEEDEVPVEDEAGVGCEFVAELVLESAPVLNIFASGESGERLSKAADY